MGVAEVLRQIKVVGAVPLEALREEAFDNVAPGSIPFFHEFSPSPDKAAIADG